MKKKPFHFALNQTLFRLRNIFIAGCLIVSVAFAQEPDETNFADTESAETESAAEYLESGAMEETTVERATVIESSNDSADDGYKVVETESHVDTLEVINLVQGNGSSGDEVISTSIHASKPASAYSQKMSEKAFSLGAHFSVAYAMLTSTSEQQKNWLGGSVELGAGFNHFFTPWFAAITGLDYRVLGFYRQNGHKWLSGSTQALKRDLIVVDVQEQMFVAYEFSLPIHARFGALWWVESGVRFDFFFAGKTSFNVPSRYGGGGYNPYKQKFAVIPNLELDLGGTIPMAENFVDMGLKVLYGLSEIEMDYEDSASALEIGIFINMWFI